MTTTRKILCGIYAATPGAGGQDVLSLAALLTLVPLCGVLGGLVGFGVGRWAGRQWGRLAHLFQAPARGPVRFPLFPLGIAQAQWREVL